MPGFQTVRGMRDLLAEEAETLNFVICKARKTAQLYGYKEVVTPVVESYDLLSAKSGEEIRQRMFIFKDLGDRTVALRPEFTASIARLSASALKTEPKPLRVFSVGSVYRYDEPQRGRYREFWQSNFELMGSNSPEADAEAILLTNSLIKATGLRGYTFKMGHIGVIRGVLSEENVDEKVQNAILQRMDKKEFDEAFKLLEKKKCRMALQGLLELRGGTPFETAKKIKRYVRDYKKAEAAAAPTNHPRCMEPAQCDRTGRHRRLHRPGGSPLLSYQRQRTSAGQCPPRWTFPWLSRSLRASTSHRHAGCHIAFQRRPLSSLRKRRISHPLRSGSHAPCCRCASTSSHPQVCRSCDRYSAHLDPILRCHWDVCCASTEPLSR